MRWGVHFVSEGDFGIDKMLGNPKLVISEDVLVKMEDGILIEKNAHDIEKTDTIIDLGANAVELARPLIAAAKLILWNGPLGKYEDGGAEATKAILRLIAGATKNGTISIIGGGDTAAVISELKIENEFTFVSTGGGAALDFLASGTLPGIKVLE
ncbi:MAG: phosphoglycerate kinase [bacterium]